MKGFKWYHCCFFSRGGKRVWTLSFGKWPHVRWVPSYPLSCIVMIPRWVDVWLPWAPSKRSWVGQVSPGVLSPGRQPPCSHSSHPCSSLATPCLQRGHLCQGRCPVNLPKTPLCGPQGHIPGRRSLRRTKVNVVSPVPWPHGRHSGPIGRTALICNHWSHSVTKCLCAWRRLLSGHPQPPHHQIQRPVLVFLEGSGASRLQDPTPSDGSLPASSLSLCSVPCPFPSPSLLQLQAQGLVPTPPLPSLLSLPVKHCRTQQTAGRTPSSIWIW